MVMMQRKGLDGKITKVSVQFVLLVNVVKWNNKFCSDSNLTERAEFSCCRICSCSCSLGKQSTFIHSNAKLLYFCLPGGTCRYFRHGLESSRTQLSVCPWNTQLGINCLNLWHLHWCNILMKNGKLCLSDLRLYRQTLFYIIKNLDNFYFSLNQINESTPVIVFKLFCPSSHLSLYLLYRLKREHLGPHDWISVPVPGGHDWMVVPGLESETTYQFSVLAQNKLGTGPFSEVVTVNTLGERSHCSLTGTKLPQNEMVLADIQLIQNHF